MEWIQANWQGVASAVVATVALGWLPFTRKLLTKAIGVLMSEDFLKELFFYLAQKYVDSTETSLDDAFLKKLRDSF